MAVPAAGSFSQANLQKINAMADREWADGVTKGYYTPNVDSILAIQKEQMTGTAFRELQTEKDKTVRLVWLNACFTDSEACSNECEIGGPELSADAQDYTLDLCRKTGFSVKRKATRSIEFSVEQKVALGLNRCRQILDEWLNTQVITFIEANKGVSLYEAPDWTQDTTEISVPAAEFGRKFIPKALMTAKRNRFGNPFFLSGENLWLEGWDASINQANSDGKGDATAFSQIRKYHDFWGIDTENAPDYKTYMINAGSIAFFSKAYYMQPLDLFTSRRYAIPSNAVNGVWYDVAYTNSCASDEITDDFSVSVKAGLFLNPTGCNETTTGIISFKRV